MYGRYFLNLNQKLNLGVFLPVRTNCLEHDCDVVAEVHDAAICFREIIETMVQAYSQKIFNNQKPVFDGRRNLYSRDMLPIGRDKVRVHEAKLEGS